MTGVTRKRMLLHKGRSGGDVKTFAMKPSEVLTSEAHRTLPPIARAVLEALADQYRGHNNGSLTLTRYTAAREYGITSPYALDESLRELEARGLIVQTRLGTRPVGTLRGRSAMFALTWWKIDPPKPTDPHEATPTVHAPDTWRGWRASKRGLHWTVPRRNRKEERDEQLRKLEEKFRAREEERRKLAGRGPSPMHPMGTSDGTQWVQRSGPTGTQRIPKAGPRQVPNGCASDISGVGGISGVGEQGKVLGGKAAGRPEGGTTALDAGASSPSSPRAELLPASAEVVQRVRDRTARAPKRYGNAHVLGNSWVFSVELISEQNNLGAKEAGAYLGRLRKTWEWPPVKLAIYEAAKIGLYGRAAMNFIEQRFAAADS